MQKQTQISIWYFLLAVLAVFWIRDMWTEYRQVEPVPYSEFQQMLKDGKVKEITVSNNLIQGALVTPENGRSRFVAIRVEPNLARELSQYPVKYTGVIENTFFRDLLSWVLPAVIFFGIWFFLVRRFAEKSGLGGGFMFNNYFGLEGGYRRLGKSSLGAAGSVTGTFLGKPLVVTGAWAASTNTDGFYVGPVLNYEFKQGLRVNARAGGAGVTVLAADMVDPHHDVRPLQPGARPRDCMSGG